MVEEKKTAIEPLSLSELAFENFEEFFESIIEQSQFTPEQHKAADAKKEVAW
jgi:hypothetical protein